LLPACTYNEGGKRVKSRLRKDHLGLGGKRDRMRRAVEVDVELLGCCGRLTTVVRLLLGCSTKVTVLRTSYTSTADWFPGGGKASCRKARQRNGRRTEAIQAGHHGSTSTIHPLFSRCGLNGIFDLRGGNLAHCCIHVPRSGSRGARRITAVSAEDP
jgi:hypothetical protein